MQNSRFEYPSFLEERGRQLWDLYVGHFDDNLPALDLALLEQACRYADLLEKLHKTAMEKSTDQGAIIRLGIATDKYLLFSSHLGLTMADRVKLKIELSAKDKAKVDADKRKEEMLAAGKRVETRGRKRNSTLDELLPAHLGIKVSTKVPTATD